MWHGKAARLGTASRHVCQPNSYCFYDIMENSVGSDELEASTRSNLLTESFERVLSYGLSAPDAHVRNRLPRLHGNARREHKCIGEESLPSLTCTLIDLRTHAWPVNEQEFQVYFPNLPPPVVQALLDLYRQVLLHVQANSKVGACMHAHVHT